MNLEQTELEGVYIINNFNAIDNRGLFVKTFNTKQFIENGLNFEIRESYYSTSKKDVIRGMHFQLPPTDHEKLVYVTCGAIIDVILDIRKNSPTYLHYISVELSSDNRKSVFIPKGLAHGFKSLEDNTVTVYNVATEYDQDADCGVKYDSFGFDWNVQNPILSKRDLEFKSSNEFNSPF